MWHVHRPRTWAGLTGLAITALFTLPAWAPILSPSFSLWQVDDGRLHMHRALFLAQLVKDGNWFPRWMPQQYGGYGYPTLNFYAPGLYYLILMLAAVSGQGIYFGTQAVTALACAGIVIGVYFLVWELWRSAPAAFLAAACVAYGPYVIQGNVYVSGSMTHVLGLTWMVWLLGACVAAWRRASEGRPVTRWWCAVAGCTAAVFLSHNAVAAVTAVVAATWLGCLALWRPSRRAAVVTISAAAVGALAVAFFWLPALLETALVQIENNQHGNLNYHNHFLTWPGFHREDVWGLQTRGPWTVGFPIDLHLIYPNSLYGPVRLGLWQALIWVAGLSVLAWQAWVAWRPRALQLLQLSATTEQVRVAALPAAGVPPLPSAGRDRGWGPPPAPHGCGRSGATLTRDSRLLVLGVAWGLLLAAACYSQTFDWALWWWERFAVVRSIQLPSRLLAPAMVGLAVALAGSLVTSVRTTRGVWVVAVLVAAVLAVSGLGGRRVALDPGVSHEMSVATAAADERASPGYTDSMDEFLPRGTGVVTWHENEARGFWLFERMFPEASWVGGRVRAWAGDVSIDGVRGRSLWTVADVTAGGAGGTVAFHQLAFSGWRAWVDGQPVRLAPAAPIEAQAIGPGFIVVPVPAGQHQVAIRFGPDPPRLVGAAVSLCVLLASAAGMARRAAGAGRRTRIVLRAAGATLAVAVAVMAARTILPLWPPA